MRIWVVTPRLVIAGVPLAQRRFAAALASRGHDVELVVGRVEDESMRVVPGVRVTDMCCRKARYLLPKLVRLFQIRSPDIVFTAEDHLNSVVLLAAIIASSKALISCSSRVTPFDTYSNRLFTKKWILKQFMRSLMPRANVLTCVSKDMVGQYQEIFGKTRHTWAYNIVGDAWSLERAEEPLVHDWFSGTERPLLVAAGRLAPWKGFSDLLDAMAIVNRHRGVKLLILGDGPDRAELQTKIDTLSLSDTVRLEGYVSNPLKYFRRASVFILSSHVEGLPNVLIEALMCGCTTVATRCPTGPREVLGDGEFGYLVPPRDPKAMAKAILTALDKPKADAARKAAIAPFSEAAVIARHFELLGVSDALARP